MKKAILTLAIFSVTLSACNNDDDENVVSDCLTCNLSGIEQKICYNSSTSKVTYYTAGKETGSESMDPNTWILTKQAFDKTCKEQ